MNLKPFLFLIITLSLFISASSAETITGSPMELINGSGSFTWTSQNFPPLRSGDTLTLTVVNNTIEKFHTEYLKGVSGINYTTKKFSFNDILRENFPSANVMIGSGFELKGCMNYLTNYYCYSGNPVYYGIVVDKKPYSVHVGDKFVIEPPSNTMTFTITGIKENPPDNVYIKGGDFSADAAYLSKNTVTLLFSFGYPTTPDDYYSPYTGKNRLLVYLNGIHNDGADLQGFVQIFREGMTISTTYGETYGKLMVCSGCSGDGLEQLTNKDDIILSEGINDMSDELKIVKNGNSIYPSANIVKRSLNVNYIPAPTSTPTPTPTVSNTPTSTPTLTPTSTVIPSITTTTQIITPAPTSTSQLEQEVKDIKERLNKTEEKQSQQESRISWLESKINSILDWLKSIF